MNGNTPPWKCRAFGDIFPEERDPIIKDISVRYHSGGSMELNARILLLAYMVYL
jgi:hypothetical protein